MLGASITTIPKKEWDEEGNKILLKLKDSKYYISQNFAKHSAKVIYSESATTKDIIKSYFEVETSFLLRKNPQATSTGVDELFTAFLAQLEEKGWNVNSHLLGVGEWRCNLLGEKWCSLPLLNKAQGNKKRQWFTCHLGKCFSSHLCWRVCCCLAFI